MNITRPAALPSFEIRFVSLHRRRSSSGFACDAQGRVEFDRLSESARKNYLFAQEMVSREIAVPRIYRVATAEANQHH